MYTYSRSIYILWYILSCIVNNSDFLLIMQLLLLSCNDVQPNPGPENHDKDLSIFHLNIRSLRNKLSSVEQLASDYDIICITETHLDNSVADDDILLDNFDLYRKDRGAPGGGINVYTSSLLSTCRRPDLEFQVGEVLWLEIQFPHRKLLLCTTYRPPNCIPSYWNNFQYAMEKALNENPYVIVVGDINVDLLTVDNNHRLVDIMNSFHLTNVIDKPTRTGRTRASLLDPILLSDMCLYVLADTIDVDRNISDHDATLVNLTIDTGLVRKYKRKIICYDEANYQQFNNLLNSTDWTDFFSRTRSANDMCDLFTEHFLNLADQCIPTKTITIRPTDKPWFNSELRREIRKRVRYLKIFKNNRTDNNHDRFRRQRNHVNNLKKRTKELFYANINRLLDSFTDSNPKPDERRHRNVRRNKI
ncbi:uncharacterized protein LOC110457857 [Mizuhopecten yessoensis]|nr:uncharacterized protein LOC110457857 [Mizuhopecten yessoensis]